MKNFLIFLLLSLALPSNSYAANWVKLRTNSHSKLALDKESIISKDLYKRAWVKIEYKTTQKNDQFPEKEFNVSKLLWFFDCSAQKAATTQVFQYLNEDLTYSAAIDIKGAEFIEPVPETDLDLAMRYVCMPPKTTPKSSTDIKAPADKAKSGSPETKTDSPETKPDAAAEKKVESKPDAKPVANTDATSGKAPSKMPETAEKKTNSKTKWSYDAKLGPESWGKLSADYATCDTGRNQSPVNIENVTKATLKPLKLIQRYTVKDISNTGNTVQASFKEGNLLILDSSAFLMKTLQFHAPSEHQIGGKSFPLEAQFMHADSKGNIAMLSVMINEGKANPALESMWQQMPKNAGESVELKSRVIASELIPMNRSYYRFTGSLTTPPCSEGVRWIVMKNPITASKEQIKAFETLMQHKNNRPTQAINGRVIVE